MLNSRCRDSLPNLPKDVLFSEGLPKDCDFTYPTKPTKMSPPSPTYPGCFSSTPILPSFHTHFPSLVSCSRTHQNSIN
nr:hypothetical protein Q903MT_gene4434 [Picea sitchensis]